MLRYFREHATVYASVSASTEANTRSISKDFIDDGTSVTIFCHNSSCNPRGDQEAAGYLQRFGVTFLAEWRPYDQQNGRRPWATRGAGATGPK